jgi:hypothetical protein
MRRHLLYGAGIIALAIILYTLGSILWYTT